MKIILILFVSCFVVVGSMLSASLVGAANAVDAPPVAERVNIVPQKELAAIFTYNSDSTIAKQQVTFDAIKGSRIDWAVEVAELTKEKDGSYILQTTATATSMGCFVFISPHDEAETKMLLDAKRGESLRVRGTIVNMKIRHLVVTDATISQPEK